MRDSDVQCPLPYTTIQDAHTCLHKLSNRITAAKAECESHTVALKSWPNSAKHV